MRAAAFGAVVARCAALLGAEGAKQGSLPWVEGAKRSAAILGAKGAVLCSFLVAEHARCNNDNEGNGDAADKRRPR